jgi:LemA protein
MFRRSFTPATAVGGSRRGAMSTGCMIGIAAAVVALVLGIALVGTYNSLASKKQDVSAKFALLDSQYKRRADLIPQLVETVKGAANFEKSTLQAVVDARASVGKVQLPPDALSDPEALKRYTDAQNQLGGALQRLLVVAEQYPQLKASQNYLSLQDQVEGTENRIAVARGDYVSSVQAYNTKTATFPGNVLGGIFGFRPLPQLESTTPEERAVPKINFGTDGTGK